MVSYKVIGKHIKEARLRLGLKQDEAAERAGISTAYYGKYERGFIKPNIDRLGDICQALCIPSERVFQRAFIPDGGLLDNPPQPAEEFETFLREIGEKSDTRTKMIIMRICAELSNLQNP